MDWSPWRESNPQPSVYKTAALPVELHGLSRGRWWSQPELNRRPLACKASALPSELWPRRDRLRLGVLPDLRSVGMCGKPQQRPRYRAVAVAVANVAEGEGFEPLRFITAPRFSGPVANRLAAPSELGCDE